MQIIGLRTAGNLHAAGTGDLTMWEDPSGTSHRQFKHPTKPGRVTIAGKLSDDLAPGTFNSILKQAGLK